MSKQSGVKLSIIIPTYNVQKYLRHALDSAVNQTLQEIEIICIDNCSTDTTADVLREYAEKDCRVRIICNDENKGVSYSRNRGLCEAKGEYILFLDADDELTQDAAEVSYQVSKAENLDILFFQVNRQYENDALKQTFGNIYDVAFQSDKVLGGMQMFFELANKCAHALTLWGKVFRNDYLLKKGFRFHENILHEDIPFGFCIVLSANRTKVISNELYVHRKREGSLTTGENIGEGFSGWLAGYCDMLTFWGSHRNEFDYDVSEKINQFLSERYRKLVRMGIGCEEISKLSFSDPFEDHIYKALMMERRLLSNQQHKLIEQYSKIIIYGAGMIASMIIDQIDENKILGIAVTDVHINTKVKKGHAVREIGAYDAYKEDALVIVAVSEKFHQEIKYCLEQKGFKHIIYIK